MRYPLATLLLLLAAVSSTHSITSTSQAAAPPTTAAQRPNIVIILSDDQGWGDLSVHGNTNLSTPNIDSLARDGALFERFFVCPVCSPTRAEFLTGRYHPRGSVYDTSSGGEMLDLDERTVAELFQAAGYRTGAFGKWHNGSQYPYHPRARGFDEYYGFPSGHWGDYFDAPLEHNGQIVEGRGFLPDDLTDHALEFIETNRDRPFFCYLPLNTPHTPLQVPDRFYEKFRSAELKLRAEGNAEGKRGKAVAEDLEKTRAVLAMCENIDWNVGRVLAKLDALQLQRNTIVLYFADNGPNTLRWNGGMRGTKGSTDEGGVRSPLLVRWPETIKPGTRIEQIAGAIDLLPTLADLAGISTTFTTPSAYERAKNTPSSPKPLDGRSLKPLLVASSQPWPEREIFSHWGGRVSCRSALRYDGRRRAEA
jgi:arylsulfatase A-like enzyme